MAWIIHHLDALEHYAFQFTRDYSLRASTLYSKAFWSLRLGPYATLSTLLGNKKSTSSIKKTPSYKKISESWFRK
jgi:hypothetical protein